MNYDPQNDSEQSRVTSPFAAPPSSADVASELAPSRWNEWLAVLLAFLNWMASIGFALLIPLLFLLLYGGIEIIIRVLKGELTAPTMMLQLVGTFGGQVLSLVLSWIIVTGMGKQSFKEALGLSWSQNFKLWHAFVLGLGMFALSALLMSILPHQETDMDKFLKFGTVVRVVLALVATIGAPIQEEIVYRGVLYGALEKSIGMRGAVILVSLLFWGVHVAQYWQSIATLVAVLLLSFVLTGLRAWSGKLLSCVATHLFFNGIQGVLIVVAPEKAATSDPVAQPAMLLLSWLC